MFNDEQIFQCPVCKHHNHKLYINVDKNVFNCFHCSFAGDIQKLKKYPSIWSKIEDQTSLSVFDRLKTIEVKQKKLLNSDLLRPLQPLREITTEDKQYEYLLSRGMDEDIIDCYDVLVSDNEHYNDRVFITVNDDKDNTVFYTGRTILKGVLPKYLNSVAKKDFVFRAVTPVDDFYTENAYICEGIFDAFKLPGGVALLGKTLGKDQHASLFAALRPKKKIYICLDPGTDRETKTLAKELDSWFPNKEIYTIQWGTETDIDVGDLSSRMSRTDVMSYVHSHSTLFTNKFF